MKRTKSLLLALSLTFCGGVAMANNDGDLTASGKASSPSSYIPEYATRLLLSQDLSGLSDEAMQIFSRTLNPIPEHYTSADTSFRATLFVPLIFDVEKLSNLSFPSKQIQEKTDISKNNAFKVGKTINEFVEEDTRSRLIENGYLKEVRESWEIAKEVHSNTFASSVNNVHMTSSMLPKDRIEYKYLKGAKYDGSLAMASHLKIDNDPNVEKVEVDRKYWTTGFESSIHFAQNNISGNWYKGGTNSLTLNMRNYLNLTYSKDKIRWVNELEHKLGLYNTPQDALSKYKISEDLLRLVSNFGLKAANNWYYTIDLQVRTQILTNKDKDGKIITRPFSPILVDGGLGMKYEIDKKFESNPFKRIRFSANFAPFSATLIALTNQDVDKARVGLKPDESYKLRLGSTFRASLNYDFSQVVNWQSRFYYNTSFSHAEAEFENTLSFALNKYFSTRFNLHLRYDDSVIKENKSFKNLLQYNQLFSFGFAYKL